MAALLSVGAVAEASAQTGVVAGDVRSEDEGTPLASVQVRLLERDGAEITRARTDGSGSFRMVGLEPGRYVVALALPGWRAIRRTEVVVRSEETTRLSLRLAPAPLDLNPITVTGTRRAERLMEAPSSMSVIDREEVARRPALTVLDHVEGVAGVDVLRTGLENGYPVTRGFNRLFDATLLLLTDHRIARMPSIRANLPRVLTHTNFDVERIEVVRGPASILYGPDAAQGVLHVITKSPIDHPGFSAALGGGSREQDAVRGFGASTEGIVQAEARWAERFSDRFGAKLSGRWFRGTDWRFSDPVEVTTALLAEECLDAFGLGNPACGSFVPAPGLIPDSATLARIGERDFGVGHWSMDGRADWRPEAETSVVVSAGLHRTESSIDLTEVGAFQVRDAVTWYGQARLAADDLFAQLYLTKNELDGPEDTFFLRNGRAVPDRSSLLVGQIQHGASVGRAQRFTYGLDVLRTTPVTGGILTGIHEDDDEFTQLGAYIQSETRLSDRWDLVLGARADHHTVLGGLVVSPRAGLVYEPTSGHSFRATFNRAFQTPGTNDLFLDQFVQRIPLGGPFSYGVRVQGGAGAGFTFPRLDGRPAMKSPFAPLIGSPPAELLPSRTDVLYRLARELLRASGSPAVALLDAVGVPTEDQVSPVLKRLDPGTGTFLPVPDGFERVSDLPPLKEQTTSTFEVGYKGVPFERLLITADLYYTLKQDFLGPFRIETPNVFLDGEGLVEYFRSRGLDEVTARALALGTEDDPGLSRIPLGVVQPSDLSDPLPNLMLGVRNFGDVDVFGADIAADYELTTTWTLGVTLSWMSEDRFEANGLDVALNAPTFKSRVSVAYDDETAGHYARLLHRFVDGFPADFGVLVGRVEAYQLVDLTLGWSPPGSEEFGLQLQIDNLFDEGYRSFPGAPELGRVVMGRVSFGL